MKIAYEMLAHYDNDKVIATIKWDGNNINVDNSGIESELKELTVSGQTFQDGESFMKVLPLHYKNGYISLRRIDV